MTVGVLHRDHRIAQLDQVFLLHREQLLADFFGLCLTAGLTHPRLYRSADDHNEVVILFDMKDTAEAKKFASSEDLKSTMKSAGVVDQPTIHFLNEAH